MLTALRAAATLILFIAGLAHAAPVLDTTFGFQGIARIGAPSGYEDVATASTMLPDGRTVIAGTSTGRQNHAFIIRFTTTGAIDSTFGDAGTVRLTPPSSHFWISPVSVDPTPDGGLLVASVIHDGFVLTRITAQGGFDASFGTGGSAVVIDGGGYVQGASPIRAAIQSDGRILVVSDASANGAFVLRFVRFLPNGALDTTFGAGGTRSLLSLPPNFEFTSAAMAVAEPGGGFTIAAQGTFAGGTYLVVRVTSQGALDTSFGGAGYISGFDVGNPTDVPSAIARTSDNGYALFGHGANVTGGWPDVLWKIQANGVRASFGVNGRVMTGGRPNQIRRAVAGLPDGAVAVAQPGDPSGIRLAVFEANGNARTSFGTGGVTTVGVAGYAGAWPVGVHADSAGRVTAAGWAFARLVASGASTIERGNDAVLVSATASGVPRSDFGRGDGTAIWNNPAYSRDDIHTLLVDPTGKINVVGFSDSSGTYDYLLSRLNPNGTLDMSFGNGGRVTPGVGARFIGIARAVRQPAGGIVVSSGEAGGSFGQFGIPRIFRITTNGTLDPAFQPDIAVVGPNSTPGLGVRPDGRIVYLSRDAAAVAPGTSSYVLQQFLADGTPDLSFGLNGRAALPSFRFDSPFAADLTVLDDGTIVFAVASASSVRIYKVNALGSLVTSFGASGFQTATTPDVTYNPFGIRVLALADGTFMTVGAAFVTDTNPTQRLVQVARFSATGSVVSTKRLAMDTSSATIAAVALPDASVVIARVVAPSVPTLVRLLPDNQFDHAFGGETGTPVTFTSVSALSLDASGGLLVGGQDASSALIARYRLDLSATSVAAVEYFNVNLRHYFVTANAAEQRSIETGGAGPGWQRTGNDFRLWVPESGVTVGAVPVCRFYGTPGRGPNSHFYTASPAECAAVKRDPGWTYEGIAFYVLPPVNDQCSGATAVYRAYNNGFARNDSNHRYSTQLSLLQAMTAQGWRVEGVAFCGASN